MTGLLEGKSGLIVGGSGDMGKAIAKNLSEQGLRVHLTSRSKDKVDFLAGQIGGHGHILDLENSSNLEKSLEELMESVGEIPDILVNAAGVFTLDLISNTTLNIFRQSLKVNLEGPFAVIRCFLPEMVDRGSGVIVNVGSVAGRVAYPENASYSSAKYGLRGLHEVLVEEIRKTGIKACLLEPSATSTKMWDSIKPDDNENLPSRCEMLDPYDVANAVVFLCTRPANVHIPILAIESC